MGSGLYRLAECRQGDAAVRRALPATPAGRARFLRPAARRNPPQAGRDGARPRPARLLLLLLLVQRPADPGEAARSLYRRPGNRLPVLHLLGERELEPALGRRQSRGPAGPGARHRVGYEIHPRGDPDPQGPALYPRQRSAAVDPLPRRPAENPDGDRRRLARGMREGRAARPPSLRGPDLRCRRPSSLWL